jgi:hypothetical protein
MLAVRTRRLIRRALGGGLAVAGAMHVLSSSCKTRLQTGTCHAPPNPSTPGCSLHRVHTHVHDREQMAAPRTYFRKAFFNSLRECVHSDGRVRMYVPNVIRIQKNEGKNEGTNRLTSGTRLLRRFSSARWGPNRCRMQMHRRLCQVLPATKTSWMRKLSRLGVCKHACIELWHAYLHAYFRVGALEFSTDALTK